MILFFVPRYIKKKYMASVAVINSIFGYIRTPTTIQSNKSRLGAEKSIETHKTRLLYRFASPQKQINYNCTLRGRRVQVFTNRMHRFHIKRR